MNGNKQKEKCDVIGIVISNEEGQVIVGSSKRINVNSCLEKKVVSLREGMIISKTCGFKNIILKIGSEKMNREIIGEKIERN